MWVRYRTSTVPPPPSFHHDDNCLMVCSLLPAATYRGPVSFSGLTVFTVMLSKLLVPLLTLDRGSSLHSSANYFSTNSFLLSMLAHQNIHLFKLASHVLVSTPCHPSFAVTVASIYPFFFLPVTTGMWTCVLHIHGENVSFMLFLVLSWGKASFLLRSCWTWIMMMFSTCSVRRLSQRYGSSQSS